MPAAPARSWTCVASWLAGAGPIAARGRRPYTARRRTLSHAPRRVRLRPAGGADRAPAGPAAPGGAAAGGAGRTESTTRRSRGSATGCGRATCWCFNDTRVIPARLAGYRRRAAGEEARIEATLIAPRRRGGWRALARPGKRLAVGDRIAFGARSAPRSAPGTAPRCCSPSTATGDDFDAALEAAGEMPLPPYIAARRPPDDARPRGLPDGLRGAARGRSRRRPPRCTSTQALLADLRRPRHRAAPASRCMSAPGPSCR